MADTVETAIYKMAADTTQYVAAMDRATAAGERAVGVTAEVSAEEEKVQRSHRSTRNELERMIASYDKRVQAEQRLQAKIEQIARLEADGIGTARERAMAIDLVTRKYQEQIAAIDRAAAAQKRSAQDTVNRQTIVPDRAADIAAVGQQIDAFRNKYVPLLNVQRAYREELDALRSPLARASLSEKERVEAIQRTKDAFAQQIVSLNSARVATDKHATSTGVARHELINMSRQIQDVGVSLGSGQSPFTVLLQQGTQIADILASSEASAKSFFKSIWSGITSVITPARLLVAGLSAVGVAIAAAFASYQSAQRDVQRSLTGVGAGSGASVADVNRIGNQAASPFGLSISEAREFASALAATGRIGVEEMTRIVAIGKNVATVFGVDATEAANLLAQAFSDPVRGAEELNKRLGFLSFAMRRQIEDLTAQNRLLEAQRILIDAVRASTEGAQRLVGFWSNAWAGFTNVVSNAWTGLGKVLSELTGVGATLERQLLDAEAELQRAQARDSIFNGRGFLGRAAAADVARVTAEIARLTAELEKNAKAQEDVRNAQLSLRAGPAVEASIPEIRGRQAIENMLAVLRDAEARFGGDQALLFKVLGITPEQLQQAIANTQRGLESFRSQIDQSIAALDLQIRGVTAFSPQQRAELARDQVRQRYAGQTGVDPAKIALEAERAGVLALRQAYVQLSEAARERRLAAEQQVQTSQLEIELITKEIGEQTRLRADLQARQQLEQEAAKNRTAFDDAQYARLQQINAALGRQAQFIEQLRQLRDTSLEVANSFTGTLYNELRNGTNVWAAFAKAGITALDSLAQRLIKMATDQLVLKALGPALGGFLGGGGGFSLGGENVTGIVTNSAEFHRGGIVGQTQTATRYIHPAYFDDAPRFHLGVDEVPAILQRGEQVIPRNQVGRRGGAVVNIKVIDRAGVDLQEGQQRTNADGSIDLDVVIEKKVSRAVGKGAADTAMRSRYGASPSVMRR